MRADYAISSGVLQLFMSQCTPNAMRKLSDKQLIHSVPSASDCVPRVEAASMWHGFAGCGALGGSTSAYHVLGAGP